MKRRWFMLMVLLVTLGASSAWGEMHRVKKWDTLSGLGYHYHVSIGAIQNANEMSADDTTIYIGQDLVIPREKTADVVVSEKSKRIIQKIKGLHGENIHFKIVGDKWVNVDANPWHGKTTTAFDIFQISSEGQAGLFSEMNVGHFVSAVAYHSEWNGPYAGKVVDDNGNVYEPVIMLSGGGKRIIEVTTGPNGVINSWPDKWMGHAGKLYASGNYAVVFYLECDNPTLLKKINPSPSGITTSPRKFPGLSNGNFPPGPSGASSSQSFPGFAPGFFPGVTPGQVQVWQKKTWDGYAGAGNYVSRLAGSDNNGIYAWMKGRLRPFWFDFNDQGMSVGVGVFGFIAGGHGKAARYYKYGWDEEILGATAKILAAHKDFDIDVGVGKLNNHGRWMANKEDRQTDKIILVSLHGNFYARRDAGKLWFPKYELNLEGRFPYDTKVYSGQKTNNRVIDFMYTQWIYDWKVNGDNSFVITPGGNLGAGYEWSSSPSLYGLLGEANEISSYGNTLGNITPYNFKFQGDGQWHPWGFYVSLDGIWNAWRASQVKEATPADLKNIK